jgi:hypothetical protein
VSTAESRALLQTVLDEGWAEPDLNGYAELLRATHPEVRRLKVERPNLADAHILRLVNENHANTFAGLTKAVVEALIKHIDIMAASDMKFVHLVKGIPDAGMFPVSNNTAETSHERIVFVTPRSVEGTTHDHLFREPHSRYGVGGVAIEVITTESETHTRLHVQIADRPKSQHIISTVHHCFVTVQTTGTAFYERFSVQPDMSFVPDVALGVLPKESLIKTEVAFSSIGGSGDFDYLFPGAHHKLAEDLPHLPQFIVDIAEAQMRWRNAPGF